MDDLKEALHLLDKLVSYPSVEGNEAEVGKFLAQYTRELGMQTELQPVEGDRANVLARVSLGSGGKTVILNSHMDVVPATDGWETDPYTLIVKDGRAYGRGSTDAKGALTAFLIATKNIIEHPDGLNGTILFTAVVDEETCSKGARYMAAHSALTADYGIVGEPTMSNVFICHKGSIRPVIKIRGKSAHASTPELGISAVRVASYLSDLVDEMHEALLKLRHPILGNASVAITMLKAGVKENVLPDTCELVLDRRIVPGENEEEIKASFDRLCCRAEEKFPGAQVFVERYIATTGPASEVKPDSEIAQKAYAACESVTGIRQTPKGIDCNTDMNHLVRLGIPCVIIGPGTLKVAHMPNEYVDLTQLETACKVVERTIRSFLS